MSFYLPRERKGPGANYETEAALAAWWDVNKDKRWNPELGLYNPTDMIEQEEGVKALEPTAPVCKVETVVNQPPPLQSAVPSSGAVAATI